MGYGLCHVCNQRMMNERLLEMLLSEVRGSPARQSSNTPLQEMWENPPLGKLCMEFLYGDGWALQCHCTRCKRPWLDAGCVCPIEHRRQHYLSFLDRFFYGHNFMEFYYVDWGAALRLPHESTDEIPWDMEHLLEFARLSCDEVHAELLDDPGAGSGVSDEDTEP